MKIKQFQVCIPENFNIEHLFTIEQPDFEYNIEFFYYFLYHIVEKNAMMIEENERFAGRNFVEIKSGDLQKIQRNYNKHISYLIKHKIIKRSPYKIGVNSYKYRLRAKYQRQKLVYIDLTDSDFVKRVRKVNCDKVPNKIRKRYNFLLKHLDFDRIKIDYESAYDVTMTALDLTENYQKYQKNLISINQIHNNIKKLHYKEKTDGRIHSPITSLSSSIRQFLTFEGEQLAEVDLSNSILYFLYLVILTPEIITINSIYTTPSILAKASTIVDSTELKDFGEKVLNGTIYELFIDDFKNEFDFNYLNSACWDILEEEYTGKDNQLRKIVKKRILASMFSKRKHYKQERQIFSNHFPTINDLIRRLKWRDHKKLSYLLFQIEAHYMIGVVARNYHKETRGKELLLTLHDCLITSENNIENLKSYLIVIFTEYLGLPPQTKTKSWKSTQEIEQLAA